MTEPDLINSNPQLSSKHSLFNTRKSIIKPVVEQKICTLCDESIDIDDFTKHTTECIEAEYIPTDVLSSSIQQSGIYEKSEDDHSESTIKNIEPENNLTDPFIPLVQQPLVDDKPDDDVKHVPTGIESENVFLDARQQSLDDEQLMNDHAEHTVHSTEPDPDTSLSSLQQSAVDNQFNDDSALYFQPIPGVNDDNNDDEFVTPPSRSPETIGENPKKYCILCYNMIDESAFIDHIASCSDSSPTIPHSNNKRKAYSRKSRFTMDDEDSFSDSSFINEEKKECIICSKLINKSEYVRHVHACLQETTTSEPIKKATAKCFSCQRIVNTDDDSSREISCPSYHIYCFPCLQNSMEEFARNRLVPLCHPTLCDYKLSRYDISLIPLTRRISNRLFQFAEGQQRPQCPKCHFYIDIKENEDFYNHIDICGDIILCEYCSCPYSNNEIDNHTIQCRNDTSSKHEKFIYFIMKRTKYPLTKEQIMFFIQKERNENDRDLDPLSIVNLLTVFESIFPYDISTRECDVCMKTYPYKDIHVFDCTDNHKWCYSCYYESCKTKMSNGEILTCSLCTNPIKDEEFNQLRISNEEINKIRDYQMKKSLDVNSNHIHGIIKCPNQNCSWIDEAEHSIEPFKVQCPLCQNEFCSLCNQHYHYRTKCQQLPHITQQWYLWCQTERTRYFTTRVQEDSVYTARLSEYNRQINENRIEELRRRYEELVQDEEYKVQHCCICPSCKRVVERLQDSDKIICGKDAHGENLQSGCGTKFDWTQAEPYTTRIIFQGQQSIIDLPKPSNPIVEHIGVKCDVCQNDVNGIRFDCINCPSLTYCEKCEQQSTLKHSQENQQSHIFRLIMTPEETLE